MELFEQLSERLRRKNTFAKLHVVGGACIALAYQRERTTEDIDVRVEAGDYALTEAIREIAQAQGLPRTWLNDQARTFIPEHDEPRTPTLYQSLHIRRLQTGTLFDGPIPSLNHRLAKRVFPAHAGMNRHTSPREGSSASVPRPRGDEPVLSNVRSSRLSVFPAHAGMNRCIVISK